MNRARRRPQHAFVEPLESRRLMDATLVDGALVITGTESKDVITIALAAGESGDELRVVVNRDPFSFALADVREIRVNTLGGNDKVTVSENAGPIYKSVTVDGGAGNDSIVTGSGNDTLIGGDGNDNLRGGDGDDFLFGGEGNDKLTGGDANDYLDGGNGNDAMTGGGADDTLLAGDGKDRLDAGTGDDNVDGGTGKDSIKTGVGTDAIAEDASTPNEVKDRQADDSEYTLAELTADLSALHETVVPGSTVFRVESTGEFMTLYYRFGSDPTAYKTVLHLNEAAQQGVLTDNVELVSREVSVSELRSSAVAVFAARTPNLGILSFKSIGNGYSGSQGSGAEEIRYRDMDGVIQTTSTNDVVWTLDEAEEDADNDGLFDKMNHDGQGGGGVPLDPSWTPFPSGDGRTLYMDANGMKYEPGDDGLYYPHFDGDSGGGGN